MPQNIYEILWIFLTYAVLGWVAEVAFAAVDAGKFVNRGFLSGPLCPIYGFGVLIVLLTLYPIRQNWVLLFLGSFLLTTVLEFFTGLILEKVFQNQWWDYSDLPFNICGYVCLKFSLLWGLGCTFIVDIVHPMIYAGIRLIPKTVGTVLLCIALFLFTVDLSATIADILALNKRIRRLDDLAEKIRKLSDDLGEDVYEKTTAVVQKAESLHAEYEVKSRQLEALRQEFNEKLQSRHRGSDRLIRAFPTVKSRKHTKTLEKLKEALNDRSSGKH